MKVNKRTIIICLILATAFLICTLIVDPVKYVTLQNIFIGLMTGACISCVIAIIGYFNEKEKIVQNTKNALTTVYINLLYIKIATGKSLENVVTNQNYKDWKISSLSGFSDINIDSITECKLELFSPMFKGNQYSFINKMVTFKYSTQNLKHLLSALHRLEQDFEISHLTLLNKQYKGEQIYDFETASMQQKHNIIISKLSKVHEYESSLLIELEGLNIEYNKLFSKKSIWSEEKKALEATVNNIMNDFK